MISDIINNEPLDNIEIDDLAKVLIKNDYRGILIDEIPSKLKNGKYIIFLRDKGKLGHWSGMIVFPDKILYVDSEGLTPIFLKSSRKKVIYSNRDIQHNDSKLCGFYVIYILSQKINNEDDLADVLLRFTDVEKNKKKNQSILYDFLRKEL